MNTDTAPTSARIIAGVVDLTTAIGYVVILGMVIAIASPTLTGQASPLTAMSAVTISLLALLLIEVPIILLWWLGESRSGTTIGKRFSGLRVVDASRGDRATRPRCLVRTVMKVLPWAICHIALLVIIEVEAPQWWAITILVLAGAGGLGSILAALVRTDKRAGHDLIAGTRVVTAEHR